MKNVKEALEALRASFDLIDAILEEATEDAKSRDQARMDEAVKISAFAMMFELSLHAQNRAIGEILTTLNPKLREKMENQASPSINFPISKQKPS